MAFGECGSHLLEQNRDENVIFLLWVSELRGPALQKEFRHFRPRIFSCKLLPSCINLHQEASLVYLWGRTAKRRSKLNPLSPDNQQISSQRLWGTAGEEAWLWDMLKGWCLSKGDTHPRCASETQTPISQPLCPGSGGFPTCSPPACRLLRVLRKLFAVPLFCP